MATTRVFRNSLSISGDTLISMLSAAGLNPQPGDTIMVGAKTLTITSSGLPGDYHYLIAAESLTASFPITLTGTAANKSPSITVLADKVLGILSLICLGETGSAGAPGKPGGTDHWTDPRGKPHVIGEPGGAGGSGGVGAPSGNAIINYCTATQTPKASAPGGRGGPDGPGGRGGVTEPGNIPAKAGPAGPRGPAGQPGQAVVSQVDKSQLWDRLDPDSAHSWTTFCTPDGPFQGILAKFSDCDLDGDGVKEIELLQLLPFEDSSEQVDPDTRLVIVLVESRLFADIPSSHYLPDDLRQRLATLKSDLQSEGFQSRFLEAKVYSGELRQEGKTLLAIRDFFKLTHNSFNKFAGALLVGSFPDARLTWLWPAHGPKTTDGVASDTYYTTGWLQATPRYDIILADLDGHWRDIYRESVDLDYYKFCITDRTTSHLSPDNFTLLLQNPTIVHNDNDYGGEVLPPLTVRDTFFVQDNVYTPPDLSSGATSVAFSLIAGNPEVSDQNKRRPNPIATPTICISRINARHIAVQPPQSAAALDANGKPQETAKYPAPETWARDPDLERTLLIDYFDRNHAFRSGCFANQQFTVSLIESANLGTSAAENGLNGLQCTPEEKLNATLLDVIRWLKKPATFRVFSAHAEPDYTQLLEESDTDTAAAESEAGGHPWRWVQEDGTFVPSFKDDTAADFCLYRTLWENRQLANVCPSLLLHVGCAVNSIPTWGNPIDPRNPWPGGYTDNTYGRLQNAGSLLFYGNQLAILCRVNGWEQGPYGFGTEFASSSSATFGDGWRAFSDYWLNYTVLVQNVQYKNDQADRKRNYEWSVLGDWTLRKYYPARWAWAHADLTQPTNAALASGNALVGFGWEARGSKQVIYLTGDGHVHELCVLLGGEWSHADLTQLTSAPPAGRGVLAAYSWKALSSKEVVYLSGDGHVHELYVELGGSWAHADLTQLTNAPPAAGTALAAYGWEAGRSKQVVYLTGDGHVHELCVVVNGGWSHTDLTELIKAPPATGTALVGYSWESACSKQVIYLTGDGHVNELYVTSGGGWAHADLTQRTNAPPATGTVLAAYSWEAGRAKQVVYLTGDGHIYELSIVVNGGWGHADLSQITGATPATRTALAGYSWEAGRAKQVVYLTGDGHIHELSIVVNGGWGHADLSQITGAPPATGAVLVGYSWEGRGSKQVVFFTGDGQVHELVCA